MLNALELQKNIEILQKQLSDVVKINEKKERRNEYMRIYNKKKYHSNIEHYRQLARLRYMKNKETISLERKLLKVYEILEDIKNFNPEYIEEIKLFLTEIL